MIRTVDAGKTWSLVRLAADVGPEALAFTDPLHGIVVGVVWHGDRAVGTILRTADGGAHWRSVWEQRSASHGATVGLAAVGVVDRRHLVVASRGGVVLTSADGGESWSFSAHVAADIESLAFPAPASGWAVGLDSRIMETSDGGSTWQARGNVGRLPLLAVAFASPKEAWAVGSEGTLVHTSDGGVQWSAVRGLPRSRGLEALSFASPDRGWAVGEDGVIYAYHRE